MSKAVLLKKITILVLVLIVPGFLYYLLTAEGKNRYKPLAIFGPKQLSKTTRKFKGKDIPDTIYHSLANFNLVDQNGSTVNLSSFNKRIFVANFFYTHCPSVCNLINGNVNMLAENYVKNKMVYFISVTVDPRRDTPPVLKKYADKFKPLTGKRLFLTGDTGTVYNLARDGFLVNALQVNNDDFIYSDKLILIDQDKHIRGYYTGASTVDVNRLNDEIKVLLAEELRRSEKPLY